MNWIMNSRVIVLLISGRTLQSIAEGAPKELNKVLLEYPSLAKIISKKNKYKIAEF